jgi:hypothetical protein
MAVLQSFPRNAPVGRRGTMGSGARMGFNIEEIAYEFESEAAAIS